MDKLALSNRFVYEFDINTKLVDDVLQSVLSIKDKTLLQTNNDSQYCTLIIPKINNQEVPFYHKELFTVLQKHIDQVSQMHLKDLKLSIIDSWITKSTFGQKTTLHSHGFSLFSGLLYLTDSPKSETIFEVPDPFFENNLWLSDKIIPQKYQLRSKSNKGKLLIWDSRIKHQLLMKDKQTRYSLAFNTWPTGVLSDQQTGKLKAYTIDVEELVRQSAQNL